MLWFHLGACSDEQAIKKVGSPLGAAQWSGSVTVPLLAGKTTHVGTVTAAIEADRLVVTYALDAGWSMTASHLDVQPSWTDIPQTRTHNPIPGQFAHKGSHDPAVHQIAYERPITWDPGVTLHLAAHADVISATGAREGAWAAGTRFTARGNWATYFTFTPTVQAPIEDGESWELRHVAGTTDDGTTFNDRVYLIYAEDGLTAAPLPSDIRDDLLDTTSGAEQVVVVSQTIVNEIVASQQAGQLTPALLAIAEPEDPAVAPAGSTAKLFGRCSSRSANLEKTVNKSPDIPKVTKQLSKNVQASLTFDTEIQVSATAGLRLKIQRYAIFGKCVPYAAEFDDVHVSGNASMDYDVTVTGTVSYAEQWARQVARLDLFGIFFMAGPVPVFIGFDLPLSVGLDLEASVSASMTYVSDQKAVASFSYVCRTGGCTGTRSFTAPTPTSPTITAGLSGRIKPSPWVDVGIRGYLYTQDFASAKIGLRPYLHGDLWGYYGNNCGDADADGSAETVRALTFDLDLELTVNDDLVLFGKHRPAVLWTSGRRHLGFWDLVGSTALAPMFSGPGSATVGAPASYGVGMRGCWPYGDPVTYRVAWGDGGTSDVQSTPPAQASASHAWTAIGSYQASATALADSHGRNLGRATPRTIEVKSPPSSVPSAGLHLWLRGDAGVTADGAGKVAAWQDQSGNGRNASMATAARQPLLVPGALNGKPVLRFGGAQSMYLDVFAEPTRFSVFVVGVNRKAGPVSMILGPGGNAPNNQLRWESPSSVLFVGTGNNLPVTTSSIGSTTVYHALSATYDGAAMAVYRDGVLKSSHAFGTTGPWILASVGSYYSSEFLEGDLAEIIVYDRAVTAAERDQIQAYLRAKYNLP